MPSRIALDTNLLVLMCVGQVSLESVGRHKRLKGFVREDFDDLLQAVSGASSLVLHPYILSEVSNLLDRDFEWPNVWLPSLRRIMELSTELEVSSRDVLDRAEAERLGLADTAWLTYLQPDTLLLTTDARLVHEAQTAGCAAAQFHVRSRDIQ